MPDAFPDLVSASAWAYAVVLAIAALDAVLPLVPSETTAIGAGVLAGAGELSLGLVIAAAAAGAFSGDNSSYIAGRRLGVRVGGWVFRGPNGLRRREWAARALATRGGYLIVVSRFVPGGRTATTFGAGLLEMRWRRFVVFAALAALLWASYAGLLGYLGGRIFEEQPWRGLVAALGVAFAITVVVETARRLRRRPA